MEHAHEIERLRSRGLSYQEAVIKLEELSAAVDSGKTYSQGPTSSNVEMNLSLPRSYNGASRKGTMHCPYYLQFKQLGLKPQALMHIPKLIKQVTPY